MDDTEVLLDIALGCPHLRKLSVRHLDPGEDPQVAEDLFLDLVLALPHLELLALGLKFRMDGELLQDVAIACPRLAILDLPRVRLCLSIEELKEAPSFTDLESIRFAAVWFENPQALLREGNIEDIANLWRNVFPKLRELPCPADIYSQYMQVNSRDATFKDDGKGGFDETPFPGIDVNAYETNWFILRVKLWRALGYGRDWLIHDRIANLWQMSVDIETTGWPVIPLEAYCNPEEYSTVDRRAK